MRKLLGLACLIIILAGTGLWAESAGDAPGAERGDDQSAVARTIRLTPSAGRGDHLFLEGVEMVLAANVPEIGSENEYIRVVTYLANDRPVARSMKSPYVAVWKPRPGTYTLRARARYKDGSESLSEPVTVMVAKRWGYPDWVQWGVSSPYGGSKDRDRSERPSSEELVIPGASSKPKLSILACNRPVQADYDIDQTRQSFIWLDCFPAYKVTGDIPDDGAQLSLPIGYVHDIGLEYPSILRHDQDAGDWSSLPSKVHLDADFCAVLTARIDNPGIYSTGVLQTVWYDKEQFEFSTEWPIVGIDTEPPDVYWLSPAKGSTLSGETELLLAASDNVGIRRIEFYLVDPDTKVCFDPKRIPLKIGSDSTDLDGGWRIDVDFSNYVSGEYLLQAVATDSSGNKSVAAQEIVVDSSASAPQVTINPPYYDEESEKVILTGTASHTDERRFALLAGTIVTDKICGFIPVLVEEDSSWRTTLSHPLPGENTAMAIAYDEYNTATAEAKYSMPLLHVGICLVRPGSPKFEGTIVQLAAQAFGGSGPTEYKYEVNDGTKWVLLRDYQVEPNRITGDENPHCTWTAGPPGEYTIRVTARDQGTTAPEVSNEYTYKVVAPLSGVSLSADPASPQHTGVQILLTATPIGGLDARFEFEVFDGQEWSTLDWEEEWYEKCDYSQRFFAPDTPGTYTIKATVREDDTTSPEFTDEMTYTITPAKRKDGEQ